MTPTGPNLHRVLALSTDVETLALDLGYHFGGTPAIAALGDEIVRRHREEVAEAVEEAVKSRERELLKAVGLGADDDLAAEFNALRYSGNAREINTLFKQFLTDLRDRSADSDELSDLVETTARQLSDLQDD